MTSTNTRITLLKNSINPRVECKTITKHCFKKKVFVVRHSLSHDSPSFKFISLLYEHCHLFSSCSELPVVSSSVSYFPEPRSLCLSGNSSVSMISPSCCFASSKHPYFSPLAFYLTSNPPSGFRHGRFPLNISTAAYQAAAFGPIIIASLPECVVPAQAGLSRIKAPPRSEEQKQIKTWGHEMKKMVGTASVPAVTALSSFFFHILVALCLHGMKQQCHSGLCSVRSQ